jgi:hypothetical protein
MKYKKIIILVVSGVILFLTASFSFAMQEENNGQTLVGKAKATIPACQDKKDYEQMFKFMFIEKDYDAASEMTSFGRCILIDENKKVVVQNVGLENIQIRIKGSSKNYWTSRAFIE